MRYPQDARRDGGSIGDDSRRLELGDEVGGILGDELVPVHRLDEGIFSLVQAGGEAIERGRQRADFAAAGGTD